MSILTREFLIRKVEGRWRMFWADHAFYDSNGDWHFYDDVPKKWVYGPVEVNYDGQAWIGRQELPALHDYIEQLQAQMTYAAIGG